MNVIVANNKSALQAAREKAVAEGFFTEIINTNLQGEARRVGKQLAGTLRTAVMQKPIPFCLISGGETTVTLQGSGKGGRNQELALSAVEIMDDLKNGMLISLATDGNDGPTESAGAVVNGQTHLRAKKLGMLAAEYLSRNDSFPFFDSLGDLLKPGYTGTNVNDLIFLFGL
jgi:glycerate 2-kinase